jgi:hypothetical protein
LSLFNLLFDLWYYGVWSIVEIRDEALNVSPKKLAAVIRTVGEVRI